ncbi:MAG: carbohydrate ABC transporter substrate-binding protein [Chloroflexi bacterium]|nr:MAG: carbohydrate ABC transporter substrate-binding protein [Chloroflexota bacterium]MBL1193776.1 carbohydrate ABC transporter substrate-binding protein [Chloroflexota bacterium]NOH11069.1 carbohydrate ABC transporter substrate-binding protein [Chloroflexota bacterium]
MKSKTQWLILSLVVIMAFALAACGGATDGAAADCVNDCLDRALAGEFSGEVVTMTGPFVDVDAIKFNDSIASFEEQTGIDIQYEGSQEFESAISIRVDAGDPPNIVDFPQPGLMANFASTGDIVDVTTFLPDSALGNYNDSWNQMATVPGPDGDIQAGVFHRFNGKSIVWYPIDDFEAAGYAIPETWDELIALSDQILADGDAPWCVGIGSGAATGWVATDWMEEIMLRTTSLENYDAWVAGDLAFSSPEVTNAAEVLSSVWSEDYVFGGAAAIVTTEFGDAPTPMFEDPPRCWLHKQGNFITSFFPESAVAGEDYGFFYLPGIDDAYGKPFLVAGDIMSLMKDSNAARAVMHYFTQGEAVKEWLAAGGALSPHLDAELSWYGNDVERGVAEIVAASTSFRFDGSDLMPGEVGAGSFWEEMTNYFSGATDLTSALENIDASWPR